MPREILLGSNADQNLGLTQAMAMEVAEHKITVNAYAPGIVGKLHQRSGLVKALLTKNQALPCGI